MVNDWVSSTVIVFKNFCHTLVDVDFKSIDDFYELEHFEYVLCVGEDPKDMSSNIKTLYEKLLEKFGEKNIKNIEIFPVGDTNSYCGSLSVLAYCGDNISEKSTMVPCPYESTTQNYTLTTLGEYTILNLMY